MSDTPVYEVTGLKHGYGDKFLLNIPHLSIKSGASVGIAGPNGSGKSTLLKLLAFLEWPSEGDVYYKGRAVTKKETGLRQGVTLLPQDPYLLKKTVFENVGYGLRMHGNKRNIKAKVHEALLLLGLVPKKFVRRHWHELSGGEAKRVALAARFVLNPDVLLLDEPTANVDRHSAFLIKEAVEKIRNKYGTSLIIVSHDHVWLNSVTDENLKLYEGSIIEHGLNNLLPGPWSRGNDLLWTRHLSDGQVICAADPPDRYSTAILEPSSIMISTEYPEGISAQNILRGTISSMTSDNDPGKVGIEVSVSGMPLTCGVTSHAARSLSLIPGKKVWVVFKATSLHWH
ncbi:MAG TPA: ATP-binding cassette domain-containing protein [Spirochaetes bacterium]|nr:ATP-binding cassette domain-containing protein [Spirochaetota bacterium]